MPLENGQMAKKAPLNGGGLGFRICVFVGHLYVLATSKNPMSKYDDFHVFLLIMWGRGGRV
jgi:hypothetical protein